jgi:hypothetical protein
MPSPEISHVVNFMLIYMEPWCAACQDLSVFLPRFHLYADAIVAKGSRIGAGNIHCRIVAFTDGTLIPTCRPHGNGNHRHKIHDFTQFSGKHRLHGHKFLGLSYPDGLISMYGPFGGTRHDGAMLLASRILIILARFRAENKGWWAIFGDSAFPFGSHCFRMTQQPQNADERAFNRIWATIRICNEWCFNHVQQFFGTIHLSHGLQMCKRNTGGRVQASVLFWNLLACWNGSETAVYFGISTPDPSVLLNAAIGVLPDNVEEV